jgi:hypothetical protein
MSPQGLVYWTLPFSERTTSPITSLQPLNINLHLFLAQPHTVLWSQVRPTIPLRHVLLGVITGQYTPIQPDGPSLRSPAVPQSRLDVEGMVAIREARVYASRLGIGTPETFDLEQAR